MFLLLLLSSRVPDVSVAVVVSTVPGISVIVVVLQGS